MEQASVLVVGAGPCGLTAACELTRHGAAVRVIDAGPRAATGTRSLLLWPPQLAVLADYGVLGEALSLGRRPEAFTYSTDTRRLARFRFTRETAPLVLPQHHTDRLLEKALTAMGVTVERGRRATRVTQTPGEVRVQTTDGSGRPSTLTAAWLIGADGAHSTVRAALGTPATRTKALSRFLLAEGALTPAPPVTDIEYTLTPRGALLIAPLPHGPYRVAGDVTGTAGPTVEEVRALLRRSRRALDIADLTLLTEFTSEESLVHAMRTGRVFLLGDAAHTHYPVGGQGANLGMQDARNLAWKLAGVIDRRLREGVLATYSTERRAAARQVLRMTGLVARIALAGPPVSSARDLLLTAAAGLPAVQDRYTARLAGLKTSYPHTPLGSPAPDRPRRIGRLSDATTVGLPCPDWARAEQPTTTYRLITRGAGRSVLRARADELVRGHPLVTRRHIDGPDEQCLLVRPDGYTACAAATARLDDVRRLLDRVSTRTSPPDRKTEDQ
ncbi:FAD-dependent oxidoreductase [Streptomyces sp. HF10]|uniref:FAD-dependent oxidoreductase n=1 Tax=Streptomyces sp. HF10 TaxID=2692233 RepID=UPI0013179907|nr:FAD-dependent monooxygenase [Streptomyces sp. HF10]QHC27497.1 NAD(P)-binding protein [Streptomyces sp. HF10]